MKNNCTKVIGLRNYFVTLQPNYAIVFMESFQWLKDLFTATDSVAHIALLYAIVIAAGVYLGKIKIGGISLGVTFVLFAGIVAGHFGFTAPTPILTFIQDFGLILFVFMIGMQVGPGFFESFGKAGIKLNGLAATAIVLNILVMFACYFIFFDTSNVTNLPMMVGTLYGAVTNTPGLGAANEAMWGALPMPKTVPKASLAAPSPGVFVTAPYSVPTIMGRFVTFDVSKKMK